MDDMESHFTTIGEPWWDDRPLIVVGGGPSLEPYDIRDLRKHGRVVIMNDAVHYCQAHILFSIDANWMRRSERVIEEFVGEAVWLLASEYIKPVRHPTKCPVNYVRRGDKGADSETSIYAAGHSGYAILGLALLKRTKRIRLLGYDMNDGPHDQWHQHEELTDIPTRNYNPKYYKDWPKEFYGLERRLTAAGVEVVNYNSDSSVRCFPISTYEEFGLVIQDV